MNRYETVVAGRSQDAVSVNKVLKNTYLLLSGTLVFAAVMAVVSTSLAPSPVVSLISFGAAFLLGMFVLPRTANSAAGIGVIFLITGLLGFSLGPMLNQYLSMPNGPQVIATAFAGTGIIFLGLSGYALTSKRDFSFMGGMLAAGMMVVLLALVGYFVMSMMGIHMPAMSLALSAVIILLMSGYILFDTSRIVHGGETNYIFATYSLFIGIFNIFVHLLSILGIMSDE